MGTLVSTSESVSPIRPPNTMVWLSLTTTVLSTERFDVADSLKERLLSLDDTAKVEIYGDQPRRVFLTYDNARLAGLGLSPQFLAGVLTQQNIVSPGGTLEAGRDALATMA